MMQNLSGNLEKVIKVQEEARLKQIAKMK